MFIIKFIRIQNLNQNFIIHRIVIIDLNIKFKKINLINLINKFNLRFNQINL